MRGQRWQPCPDNLPACQLCNRFVVPDQQYLLERQDGSTAVICRCCWRMYRKALEVDG